MNWIWCFCHSGTSRRLQFSLNLKCIHIKSCPWSLSCKPTTNRPAAIPWSQFHIYCSLNREIAILLNEQIEHIIHIWSAHFASRFSPRRIYDNALYFDLPLHCCWMAVTNKTGSPLITIIFCILNGHYFVITHKIPTQSNSRIMQTVRFDRILKIITFQTHIRNTLTPP